MTKSNAQTATFRYVTPITEATLDGKAMAPNLALNAIAWNQVEDLRISNEPGNVVYRGTINGQTFIAR